MCLLIITTTITDEWLNNLIFPDNSKCITVNGQMIIYIHENKIMKKLKIGYLQNLSTLKKPTIWYITVLLMTKM